MNHTTVIDGLSANQKVFETIFKGLNQEEYCWKPGPLKWSSLDIVCHLYDEEREDFRTRVRYVLEDPKKPLPMFDPLVWVAERNYLEQDFNGMTLKFLDEREKSVDWLASLVNPPWKNAYNHPKLGPLTAEHFLFNWLAHDYLHIRQIQKVKFQYLAFTSDADLSYAGNL